MCVSPHPAPMVPFLHQISYGYWQRECVRQRGVVYRERVCLSRHAVTLILKLGEGSVHMGRIKGLCCSNSAVSFLHITSPACIFSKQTHTSLSSLKLKTNKEILKMLDAEPAAALGHRCWWDTTTFRMTLIQASILNFLHSFANIYKIWKHLDTGKGRHIFNIHRSCGF